MRGAEVTPLTSRPKAYLRGREPEDVGVPKLQTRAVLLRRRPRHGSPTVPEKQAPGVDGRAVDRVASVVPDRRPVCPGGGCIDVVAEELTHQVVLAAGAGIARSAPVHLSELSGSQRTYRGVKKNTNEQTRRRGERLVRRREGVVNDVDVRAVG